MCMPIMTSPIRELCSKLGIWFRFQSQERVRSSLLGGDSAPPRNELISLRTGDAGWHVALTLDFVMRSGVNGAGAGKREHMRDCTHMYYLRYS